MSDSTKNKCLRAIGRIKEMYCKPCGLAICPHDCEWYEAMIGLRNGSGDNPLELETLISINTIFSDRMICDDIREYLIEKGVCDDF